MNQPNGNCQNPPDNQHPYQPQPQPQQAYQPQPQQAYQPQYQPAYQPQYQSVSQAPADKRTPLRILNIVMAVLCLVSVLSYALLPVWRISVSMDASTAVKEIAGSGRWTSADPGGAAVFFSGDAAFTDADGDEIMKDLARIFEDEDIRFELSLDVGAVEALMAVIPGIGDPIKAFTEKNAGSLIEKLSDSFAPALKPTLNAAAKRFVDSRANEIVSEAGGENADRAREILNKAGIDDKWIEGRVEAFCDELESGEATPRALSGMIVDVAEDAVTRIAKAEGDEIDDSDLAQLKDEVFEKSKKILDRFADDDGVVSLETAVEALLGGKLEDIADELDLTASDSNPAEEYIENLLNGETRGALIGVMAVVGVLLIISVISWLYLFIALIVKLFKPNPGTALWPPMVFGWPMFIILVAIPALAFTVGTGLISGMNGVPAEAARLMESVKVGFFSSSCIAAAAALVIFIIGFFYRKLRKQQYALTGQK